jgi:hypothetical protein
MITVIQGDADGIHDSLDTFKFAAGAILSDAKGEF